MFELKKLSAAGVPAAIAKAERYRLLNEPWHAESICRDILEVDSDNQPVIVMLILALTDQFGTAGTTAFDDARRLVPRLTSEYEREYYEGIICERRAKAHFDRSNPGAGSMAHEWYERAMACFVKAEGLQPAGVEDATLRWNTCARMLTKHPSIQPAPVDNTPQMLE